ncbi:uncharacterized protein BX663DRAFT_509166 [Cokeromyces recurvatus]|uniref:uncharacterized protein n=1 Tax=Cokeromyces recurvatus TaxID=90255 RepID=UPI0022200C11|nr:uncharacterized protein BX663DRAFT_509166 [Cokeromyces recurvatus]KAI7903003.1 hypothetical protein BX663DRAFT_509166 [Cokeromyces recurvatus]
MGELTEQEKLERRRLKRQQRILQSGESRLNKITGTAFPNRITPSSSPSPSPSTSAVNKSESIEHSNTPTPTRQRRPSDDPSDELGAPHTLNNSTPTRSLASNNTMFNERSLANNEGTADPFEQLLAAAMSNANDGGGFNPLAALLASQNINKGNGNETSTNLEALQMTDKSAKYWNLLHLMMMTMLGFYAVYAEWTRAGSNRFASLLSKDASLTNFPAIHVPLFWYFITLEVCMQSARLFYQQGKMPTNSNTLIQLATQLPHPFGQLVTIFLRYRLIWSCFIQDICILVFIIGISQVISNILLSS